MDEQEISRDIDKEMAYKEKNQLYCESCHTWISRHVPHGCKEVGNGKS